MYHQTNKQTTTLKTHKTQIMQQATLTFGQAAVKTNKAAEAAVNKDALHKIMLFVAIVACVVAAVHI